MSGAGKEIPRNQLPRGNMQKGSVEVWLDGLVLQPVASASRFVKTKEKTQPQAPIHWDQVTLHSTSLVSAQLPYPLFASLASLR